MEFQPGQDVWVDFEGATWPGEVQKVETTGYIRCTIVVDPEWDFGALSARMSPYQTVAVKPGSVRERTSNEMHDMQR